MSNAKNWCWTLHYAKSGCTADELSSALQDAETRVRAWPRQYSIWGREVCPETGGYHLQGYTQFLNKKRLSALKKIHSSVHWEVRKGSHKEAADYCKEDGDWTEEGDPVLDGPAKVKANWDEAFLCAKEGKRDEIPAEMLIKNYRTFKQIELDYAKTKDDLDGTCGQWYVGESGTGKSREARAKYKDAYLKRINKWWDGYQGEEEVIIDDVDKTHKFLSHDLKIWADRYAYRAETKGGGVSLRPKVICVTSQYTIEQIWEGDDETIAALKRRFHVTRFY